MHDSEESSPGPYFFLSYAHTPRFAPGDQSDPDVWVERLYSDLCAHIMQISDLPRGVSPGFMDRHLRPGDEWSRSLSTALATCKVFVPLYSRRYFQSEHCGREWAAFAQRTANQATRAGRPVEAIVPAVWVPVEPDRIPEVAKSIQFDHRALGDLYASHGFYGLIKLSRFREAYEEAVYLLARRIIDVALHSPVPPGPAVGFGALAASAFGPEVSADPGRRRAMVTVAAPDMASLPDARTPFHYYYGESATDWNPYRPDSVLPVAGHAAALLRNYGYTPRVGSLDEHAGELLSDSPNGASLLLLDPWATLLPKTRDLLQRLDKADNPQTSVMVLWNRLDEGMAAAEDRLRDGLEATVPRMLSSTRAISTLAARGVPNLDDFALIMPQAVRAAERWYLRSAQSAHPRGPSAG